MNQAFDIASLHEAYTAGLSPRAVAEEALTRIAGADDPGIFLHVGGRDEALAQADALGSFDPVLKPLWGLPFAVKDNIDVVGWPTTAACPDFAYVAQADAEVVARLRAAGAIVIGKTNLDQFATGLVGLRTPYPAPKNAIDPALVPGGSSSGSAVAVARGIVCFALGTDTAGSGRVPAGLNNIVGLKPTVGAIPTAGVVPACRTLDCVSIFALTSDDALRVLEAAAPSLSRAAARPPVLMVGVPAKAERRFFGDVAMQAAYEKALAMLEALGCRLVELPFTDFYATADLLYEGPWVAERYAAIADFFESRPESLHPTTRAIIGGAKKFSAADAFRGLYALADLKARLAPVMASVDLICVPTAPTHYTVEQVLADPVETNSRLGTYTNFVNLLDMCGTAVPVGTRTDGLPMSVTILAPAGRDALAAAVARDLHAASGLTLGATGWALPASAHPAAWEDGDRIEIVVVGAHLSGMALNHELQALGAGFARSARTAPGYRLYALAGQTPQKPGLIRDAEGRGGIDVEVWRMEPAAFGRFVAAIPAPLGIGTIRLDDGTAPKGFLVEEAGLVGARDITNFGGWRAYTASL